MRLVLFDLDGTLVDSAPDLVAAANFLREKEGLKPLAFEALREYSGKGARGLIRAALGIEKENPRYAALEEAFLTHYNEHKFDHLEAFPGIQDVIKKLTTQNFLVGIVTNKNTYLAAPVVDYVFGKEHPFVTLVGGDAPGPKKPKPDHILLAIKEARCDVKDALYVGDDQRDIQAAKNTGIPSVAVTWGYTGGGNIPYTWGADKVIANPTELVDFVTNRPQ